jgi:hypothetical protein
MRVYRSKELNPNGKRNIVFSVKDAYSDRSEQIPCGQCIGCRLDRSRIWAIRCMHEASMFDNNCFITLTYDDEHLPFDGSLNKDDWQKFMKRLRKRFKGMQEVISSDKSSFPIRYFHAGEYGDRLGRPHYHACLFNFDFEDKEFFKTVNEQHLYTSKTLQELWPFGFSTIGSVTFDSAAYVARYIMKKIYGDSADEHYSRFDPITGELRRLLPEYCTQSRRPGIAANWYTKFSADVYPDDFVVVNGRKVKPPKYYDSKLEMVDPYLFEDIKHERYVASRKHLDNNTPDRLEVREKVKMASLGYLIRDLE